MYVLTEKDIKIVKEHAFKKIPTLPKEKLSKSQLLFYNEVMDIVETGKKIDTISKESQAVFVGRVQAIVAGLKFGSEISMIENEDGDHPNEKPDVKCTQVCREYDYDYGGGLGFVFLICVIICVFVKMGKKLFT